MKALLFDGSFRFVENHPAPRPVRGEARVRVLMAAICGTDLEIAKGYKGFRGIPGHEFVGVVEMVNGADRGLIGKRVVGEINCGCGTCDFCVKGSERHCVARTVLGIAGRDGAFAEYLVVPTRNLWHIPDCLTDEEAVFVEPLAAAFEILEQVHVKPTDHVLVVGDGRIGLLASFVLRRHGAQVMVAGRHETKLAIAGRAHVETRKVDDLPGHKKYDVVVEATGSADGIMTSLALVKPRGVVVLKSTVSGRKELNLSQAVVDEITIVGSRCGPFAPAIDALSTGLIDVSPLITAVYPFDRVLDAIRRAEEKETVKVLLDLRRGR